MKLRKEIEYLTSLEATVHNLEIILNMVKAKRSDLRDVQGRLKDQIKLCQEDIGIGRRWGQEKIQAVPKPIVTPDMAEELLSPIDESFQTDQAEQPDQVTDQDINDELVDIDSLLESVDNY